MEKKIPKDPIMCMSFVNTKLRDSYLGLDEFCRDYETDREELERKLEAAGYIYDKEQNRFR